MASSSRDPRAGDVRSSESTTRAAELQPDKPERPSLGQILTGALTAVSATALLSFLGLWGTILGMGLLSVLTVLGNYMYSSFIHRASETVKHVQPTGLTSRPKHPAPHNAHMTTDEAETEAAVATDEFSAVKAVHPHDGEERSSTLFQEPQTFTEKLRAAWRSMVERYGPRRIVASIVVVFILLAATITAIEAVAGKPMSDIVRNESGSGTSLFVGRTPEDSTGDDRDGSGGVSDPEQQQQDDSQEDQRAPEEPDQEDQQDEQAPPEDQAPVEEPQEEAPQDEEPQNEQPAPVEPDTE